MNVQTISLACPTCGNASNITAKQVRFGYEFTCPFCHATSVMIINKQLYAPKPGELICSRCGNVNPPGSRFCSCGNVLVTKCEYCFLDFPAEQARCPHCGRLRINGSTQAQLEAAVQDAIQSLSSPNESERLQACEDLQHLGSLASAALPALGRLLAHDGSHRVRIAACQLLSNLHPDEHVVPVLLSIVENEFSTEIRQVACQAVGAAGAAGASALPLFCRIIPDDNEDAELREKACYAALAICSASGNRSEEVMAALTDAIANSLVPSVQRTAWEVLSKMDHHAAAQALEEVIANEKLEWNVRESACTTLHRVDPDTAIRVLQALITGQYQAHTRRSTAGPQDTNPQTARELNELNSMLHETSYLALCQLLLNLDQQTAIDTLIGVVKDHHAQLQNKVLACRMLGEIGAPAAKAAPIIVNLLTEPHFHEVAYTALKGIGKPALPAIEPLVGFFAPGETKHRAKELIEEINRQH